MQRIAMLESKVNSSGSAQTDIQRSELEAKCSLLLKEREAVCTIMEQKIKVLVLNISNTMTFMLQAGSSGDSSAGAALAKV